MSQTFLTVQDIAKESLLRLRNQLVMGALVHRDFSGDFASKGDTVQVRKPATFSAVEFNGSNASAQDIVEDKVLVSLDKIADVTVDVTAKELTLNVQDFGSQVVEGAMQALAQKIDTDLMSLYKAVPYISGGSTPGNDMNALADVAQARKVLNDNKSPMSDRRLVVGPTAEANLIVLDAIASADRFGGTQALKEANLGRVFGMDTYMSQNIASHTKGTASTFNVAGTAGGTTLAITTATNGHTFLAGDIITVTGVAQAFAVAANVTVAETIATVTITEPVRVTFATPAAGALKANHVSNLAFHRDAFALVMRPMALPLGGANGAIESFEGLTVRTTMGYAMATKKNTISFDILYGVKCLEPKLAARVWRV